MGTVRQTPLNIRGSEVTEIFYISVWKRLNFPGFSVAQRIAWSTTEYSKCGKSQRNLPMFLLAAIGLSLFQMLPAAGKPQLDVTEDLLAKFVTSTSDKTGIRLIVIAANNEKTEFLDNLFGENDSTDKQVGFDKPPKQNKPADSVEREQEKLERNKPDSDVSYVLDYLNLETLDFGFAIEGVPEAAFSIDIPNFWNPLDNSLSHQLIFASPDSDPDAKATLAITGKLANGRTDQDAALALATELVNIGGAEIIDSRKIGTAAGSGWRVLLKVNSPSDVDIVLIDELVVIIRGSTLYQLELTALEPIWHAAKEVMKRALATIFIWK